ncbi:MAG TPA: SRPBCC family protein [Streptosporangiaceae bacterium]
MAHIEGEIMIERPVDEVFDFVADERNEPRYNPRMVLAEKTSPGPVGLGTTFTARTMTMGRPVDMTIETTGYERPRRLKSSTVLSNMAIHGTLSFDARPGGTLMRWCWDVQPHGLLKLMTPLIARQGKRQEEVIWTGLKHYLESGGDSASGTADRMLA